MRQKNCKVDPQTIPDNELRPWMLDEEYEMKMHQAMSNFDETCAETNYGRNAGSHTHSDLDKIRHDELVEFEKRMQSEYEKGSEGEGTFDERASDSYDILHVHDTGDDKDGHDDSFLNEEMQEEGPCVESDEEDEDQDVSKPLGEDEDLLAMTSAMNTMDKEAFMKARTMRILLQREKKKRERAYRHGQKSCEDTVNLSKIPSARYMPVHKTRVYKEWLEAQNELRMSESMKAKARLLDRPTTAFIDSLIEKEREILAKSLGRQLEDSCSGEQMAQEARSSQEEAEEARRSREKEQADKTKCLSRFNALYPDLSVPLPGPISPIATSRPATSWGQSSSEQRNQSSDGPLPLKKPASLRPITADAAASGRPRSRPAEGQKALGKGDFPTANSDSIPSSNSAINKYRTPREQMLSSLRVTTRAEEEAARKRASQRVKQAELAVAGLQGSREAPSSRFSGQRASSSLDRLSISSASDQHRTGHTSSNSHSSNNNNISGNNISGNNSNNNSGFSGDNNISSSVSNNSSGDVSTKRSGRSGSQDTSGAQAASSARHPVFLRPPKNKVKKLRDLMRTTQGVDSRLFNKGFQSRVPYDAQEERQKTLKSALRTKEVDHTDSTTECLVNPGFFEALGPKNIFLSESSRVHVADDRHKKQIITREKSHITEPDFIKTWANESLSNGRKLFHSGGGGFHYS